MLVSRDTLPEENIRGLRIRGITRLECRQATRKIPCRSVNEDMHPGVQRKGGDQMTILNFPRAILFNNITQLKKLSEKEGVRTFRLNRPYALYSNQLSGPIPASHELGNMKSLDDLELQENNLNGIIPASLGKLSNLELLFLRHKAFAQVKTYKDFIDLRGNKFHGELSANWGRCFQLATLRIASNNLTGTILPELGLATKLQALDVSSNRLEGEIPKAFSDLTSLGRVDLSNNQLSNAISTELGSLTNLDGDIPPQLSNLQDLMLLNISHNSLTGEIPTTFEQLRGLQDVDLSKNMLVGPVPNSEAFQETNLEANMGLCGNVTGLQLCGSSKKHDSRKLAKILKIVLPIFGAGTLFYYRTRKRSSKEGSDVGTEKLVLISVIDGNTMYEEIVQATENFDETHCNGKGGSGSVYKVEMPSKLGSL
ncbi:hypothetical protein K2173_027269 [Erythroxylum novogranatense]|uniref:Uncharacterized protein n=1 Tax=Erythroxylum novogranatense TaxID=1862640 RepID=A0AAV8TYK9_9ROSI|nr:hypothetical protein K2173_027269 [Erythroxylum novogranatense]